MRGALVQQDNPRTAAHKAIRAAYDARTDMYEQTCMPMPLRRYNVCSIRLNEEI